MEIDHRIIISIHIPIGGLSRQRAEQEIAELHKRYYNTFPKDYIVLFFPNTNMEIGKVEIECINTENVGTELEEMEDLYEKFEEMKNYSISKKAITKFKL
jgi:hypothetical protein